MEVRVLARRNKKQYIFLLAAGAVLVIVGVALSVAATSAATVAIAAIGGIIFLPSLWLTLNPSAAIVLAGGKVTIRWFLYKKVVSVEDLEYVACSERDAYPSGRSGAWLDFLYRREKDIRLLTLSYRENGILRHAYVVAENASAAKAEIDMVIDEKK